MKGGLQNSMAIKDCLIDHSIPFLPLEKQHVIKCIQRDFLLNGVQSPNEEKIE
jgi:torsin-1